MLGVEPVLGASGTENALRTYLPCIIFYSAWQQSDSRHLAVHDQIVSEFQAASLLVRSRCALRVVYGTSLAVRHR